MRGPSRSQTYRLASLGLLRRDPAADTPGFFSRAETQFHASDRGSRIRDTPGLSRAETQFQPSGLVSLTRKVCQAPVEEPDGGGSRPQRGQNVCRGGASVSLPQQGSMLSGNFGIDHHAPRYPSTIVDRCRLPCVMSVWPAEV